MGLALAARRPVAEEVRAMAHDALDAWLDQLEADTAETPTLREISERFLQTRHGLLSACLEAVISPAVCQGAAPDRSRVRVRPSALSTPR